MKAYIEETEPEAEHWEVPKERTAVKPVGGLRKRHRGRKLAARQRGKPKELTQGDCGSGRKLVAACRKVSRLARVAWRKRNFVRNKLTSATDERAIRRVRTVWTLRERVRTRHEGRKGVKDLGGRRPLCLRKERTTKNGIEGWSSGQRSHLGSGGTLKKALSEIF
jgi:hypothetical protein